MSSATTTPVAPEFVIGFPADFRDLEREPATWEAAATAFLDLVPVARPPEYRELALAHLRAYSALLATGGVVKAAACLGSSGGALSTASVLVSWLPAPPAAPADIAAMGLFAALSQAVHRPRGLCDRAAGGPRGRGGRRTLAHRRSAGRRGRGTAGAQHRGEHSC